MSAMASQITSLTIVYLTVYSGADQRKHKSSWSLAFVRGIHRWPVNSPHKWPVTRKMFPFHDVIMTGDDPMSNFFNAVNVTVCEYQADEKLLCITFFRSLPLTLSVDSVYIRGVYIVTHNYACRNLSTFRCWTLHRHNENHEVTYIFLEAHVAIKDFKFVFDDQMTSFKMATEIPRYLAALGVLTVIDTALATPPPPHT